MAVVCSWRSSAFLSCRCNGPAIPSARAGIPRNRGAQSPQRLSIRVGAKEIGTVDIDGVPSDLYSTTSNEDSSDRMLDEQTRTWWNPVTVYLGVAVLSVGAWQLVTHADPSISFTVILWSWWFVNIYAFPMDYKNKLQERKRIEAEAIDDPYGENVR